MRTKTDEFLRLNTEGHSTAALASMLHVTPRTITRWRQRYGVAKGEPSRPMTVDELATARAMLSDGCSGAEVARTIGRSPVAVRRRFPDLVWTKADAARFARMPTLLSSLSIGGANA